MKQVDYGNYGTNRSAKTIANQFMADFYSRALIFVVGNIFQCQIQKFQRGLVARKMPTGLNDLSDLHMALVVK